MSKIEINNIKKIQNILLENAISTKTTLKKYNKCLFMFTKKQ